MTLLLLIFILVVPYIFLTLAKRLSPSFVSQPITRARLALSFFFAYTALMHFISTDGLIKMLPSTFLFRSEIIYLVGALELFGAVGLLIPRLARAAGVYLIVMLAVLLPANIYSAFNYIDFAGHGIGPVFLLVRIPFQYLLICLAYWSTAQKWFEVQNQYAKLSLR
jgi:uncharacterized membrane protein